MLAAVLFDLDGTLLDIELDRFLREYFDLLGPVVGELSATAPKVALAGVIRGTEAMAGEHPGRTNRDVFIDTFRNLVGIDLGEQQAAERIDRFYANEFPSLRGSHGPRAGGLTAVNQAVDLGLKTALATNPIFPYAAIAERARWAGLELETFDVVTTYENSMACKPHSAYFRGVAEALGVTCAECLMVGDDPRLDLGAAATGMRTFFVGDGDHAADWTGDLHDLVRILPSLV